MAIYVQLNPLYQTLLKSGFANYLKSNEFGRLCNKLTIGKEWAFAQNEAMPKSDSLLSFFGPDDNLLVAHLLNQLYKRNPEGYSEKIAAIIVAFLHWSNEWINVREMISDLESIPIVDRDLQQVKNEWLQIDKDVFKKISQLESVTVDRATGGLPDPIAYKELRGDLVKHPSLKPILPEWLIRCSSIDEFWIYIKEALGQYQARRTFLQNEFSKLKEALIQKAVVIETTIVNYDYLKLQWQKAVDRINFDPEGAITTARSLLETICKHILEASSIEYDDTVDLPILYKKTAGSLNLAPDQHTESIFKQILSGCSNVVHGLGSLRNKLSDAHGRGPNRVRAGVRHATLAVNLAGAVAQFLLETLEERQSTRGTNQNLD